MKRILTLLALSVLCIGAAAQSFEGTFTQTRALKVTGKTIKSAGNISFTAPDQLAMIYTQPEGDYFIVDGPFLRMDLRGIALDVNTDNNKTVRLQRNAILYSIRGLYEDIAREMDADCTVTPAKGGKHVVIKVRKPVVKGYTGMELNYKADGSLSRMVLEEAGKISTEYLLSYK